MRSAVALACLVLLASPDRVDAQSGALHLEIGAARSFPPSGTDVPASNYLTGGLHGDWSARGGGGVFGGVYAGANPDGEGGDWGAAILGGRTVVGSGAVSLALTAFGYGFLVGEPFVYETLTGEFHPELRFAMGPIVLALQGEAGTGRSDLEFHRGDRVRSFSVDLWHYGGGPEVRLPFDGGQMEVSAGRYETERGVFDHAELRVFGALGAGPTLEANLVIWGTPTGTEAAGGLSVRLPVGAWYAEVVGGRSSPDPLVRSEPGGQGGVTFGRTLLGGASRRLPAPIVSLEAGPRAVFTLEHDSAERIELLGDFTLWEPIPMVRDGSVWTTSIAVERGTFHFGFMVDGEWFVPRSAPGRVSDDWGQVNATLVVP